MLCMLNVELLAIYLTLSTKVNTLVHCLLQTLTMRTKCLPNALGNSTQGSACVLHIRFNEKQTNTLFMNKKKENKPER